MFDRRIDARNSAYPQLLVATATAAAWQTLARRSARQARQPEAGHAVEQA